MISSQSTGCWLHPLGGQCAVHPLAVNTIIHIIVSTAISGPRMHVQFAVIGACTRSAVIRGCDVRMDMMTSARTVMMIGHYQYLKEMSGEVKPGTYNISHLEPEGKVAIHAHR